MKSLRCTHRCALPPSESLDLKGIATIPPPTPAQTRVAWVQAGALTMIGTGVLIAGVAYAYSTFTAPSHARSNEER